MKTSKLLREVLSEITANFGVGVSSTAHERHEQINKHGFSLKDDAEYYKKGELVEAARFCLGVGLWPANWDKSFGDKILCKSMEDRFVVAAALLCAEVDRLNA